MVLLVLFITFATESWKKNRFDLFMQIFASTCFPHIYSQLIHLLLLFFIIEQSHVFLLNCDVCCSFPLQDILGNLSLLLLHSSSSIIFIFFKTLKQRLADAHRRYGGIGTMLVIKVLFLLLCS